MHTLIRTTAALGLAALMTAEAHATGCPGWKTAWMFTTPGGAEAAIADAGPSALANKYVMLWPNDCYVGFSTNLTGDPTSGGIGQRMESAYRYRSSHGGFLVHGPDGALVPGARMPTGAAFWLAGQ